VDVTGAERLRPAQALLHGLARVVAQEYPGMACGTVDVVAAEALADPTALADELASPGEPSVALRAGYRWLPGYERLPLPPEPSPHGGTYLITGGLGRIGLALAEDLARGGPVRLVLVSRTELPSRDRWADAGDRYGPVLGRLAAIERAGGTVLPLAADVADRCAMAAAFAEAERRFGPLDGVVHAAGAVGPTAFAPLAELDSALVDRHFAAKVDGTLVLDELLADRPPAVAMFASSLAGILGGIGFGPYAAANAFLDAYAAGPGRGRWTSVGWEGWAFTPTADPRGLAKLALSPAEGTAVCRRLMVRPGPPRVVVSTGDLTARVSSWVDLGAPAPLPGHVRPTLGNVYAAPVGELERTVARIWQELLGVAEVGRDDDFFALGGHSLLAIQVISRLRDALGVELSLNAMFDGPTVAQLAATAARAQASGTADQHRLEELLDLVEELSEEEVERLLAAEDGAPDG
jgi:phthiocerol/phenolphthiocerol synthesis type-I polyketide synthase E